MPFKKFMVNWVVVSLIIAVLCWVLSPSAWLEYVGGYFTGGVGAWYLIATGKRG